MSFDLQAGHEQAGRCPALVLSPEAYNRKNGLRLADSLQSAVVCGIIPRMKLVSDRLTEAGVEGIILNNFSV